MPRPVPARRLHRRAVPVAVFLAASVLAVVLWRYAVGATDGLDPPLARGLLAAGLACAALLGVLAGIAARARERALRETESLMEGIAENVPVIVAVHDVDFREVIYVNRRFETIYGRPAESLLRDPGSFLDLVHPEDREGVVAAIRRDLPEGAFDQEYRIVRPDGAVRWVRARSGLVPGAEDDRRVATIVEDVTERRRAERELERSNADLQQFAYVASHDLQEPLRMVTSYLGLVERRYADRIDDRGREFIAYAVDGATRMKRLIHGLLAYARVNAPGEDFRDAVDLDAPLDEALANLSETIRETGATIRRDPMPTVRGEPSQLALVFQNLLSNALKFRDDGPPEIEVGAAERPDGWEITVADDGVGFDPRLAGQLFVPFHRLHGRAEFPGTGIGLALCRRIVERHGGRIRAETEPGVGTAFHFTLPRAPEVTRS